MARVYFPGCKIKAKYPEASERMAQLVRERGYAGEAAGCCRVNHQKLAESDVAVALCCNCMAMIDEDAANGRLDYLYALIDADGAFPPPDWGGVEMGLQDCGRAYDRPELHDAIRSLLVKMNVRVVELPDARQAMLGLFSDLDGYDVGCSGWEVAFELRIRRARRGRGVCSPARWRGRTRTRA